MYLHLAIERELFEHVVNDWVVEIFEHLISDRTDLSAILEGLGCLSDAGIKIALDDFGTEQSNFHRLASLPVDIVKLDKSLIDTSLSDERHHTIIRTIAMMAQSLNPKLIAEGIEQNNTARSMLALNISSQQGYLHSRPASASEIAAKPDAYRKSQGWQELKLATPLPNQNLDADTDNEEPHRGRG